VARLRYTDRGLACVVGRKGEALIDGRNLKVAGWEKDSEGKLRPRVVSLADSMDPQKYVFADTHMDCPAQSPLRPSHCATACVWARSPS
jgi:hypothetical protein